MAFGRMGGMGRGFGRLGSPLGGTAGDFPYPTFPYTTLAQFHTTADFAQNSGATFADTTMADSPYGSTAVQATFTGSAASLRSTTILSTPVDVRNGVIRFTFKPISGIYSGGNPSVFNIRLYSAGTPSSPSANYHVGGSASGMKLYATAKTGLAGRWQGLGIPVNTNFAIGGGTGADLTAIKYAQFICTASNGVQMGIGDIDFLPNPRTKAALIFRCDDCGDTAYTVLYPLLQAVGAPGFLAPGAVNTAQGPNNPGRLSDAQITELLANGWQFGSQSYSTEDATTVDGWDSATRLQEYVNTRNFSRRYSKYRDSYDGTYYSNVGPNDMIAYPELAATFRTLLRFDAGSASNPPVPLGEGFPFGDPKNISTLNLAQTGGSGATLTTYMGYALEQARQNKGVIILTMHPTDLNNADIVQCVNDAITEATVTNPSDWEITTPRRLLSAYNGDTLAG